MVLIYMYSQPSQVGVALSSIGFNAFFGTIGLGPVASTGPFNLLPLTTSPLPLAGRLVPQTSASGLAAVSTVFNNFIHGMNSNVTVQGTSAGPSSVSDTIRSLFEVTYTTGHLAQRRHPSFTSRYFLTKSRKAEHHRVH